MQNVAAFMHAQKKFLYFGPTVRAVRVFVYTRAGAAGLVDAAPRDFFAGQRPNLPNCGLALRLPRPAKKGCVWYLSCGNLVFSSLTCGFASEKTRTVVFFRKLPYAPKKCLRS